MFDIWYGDIELTTATLLFSLLILLPVQLLLCFKVKSRTVRLIPVAILSALTAVMIALFLSALGWDRAGYALLAIFSGFMLFSCGIGWGVWAIVNGLKKKYRKE